jgi:cold shock CspA family protein
MQGVIKSYDPRSGTGVVMCDSDLSEIELAQDALEASIFRMLRQGQRVVFELDDAGHATQLSFGSEADLGAPTFPGDLPPAESINK